VGLFAKNPEKSGLYQQVLANQVEYIPQNAITRQIPQEIGDKTQHGQTTVPEFLLRVPAKNPGIAIGPIVSWDDRRNWSSIDG
jgi:hypothetical protein